MSKSYVDRKIHRYMVGLAMLILIIPVVSTSAGGSWFDENGGLELTRTGKYYRSNALVIKTEIAASAKVTLIRWQYRVTTSNTNGLEVELCSPYRCELLSGRSGQTRAFAGEPADTERYFRYRLTLRGQPRVQVVKNQVAVNYQG